MKVIFLEDVPNVARAGEAREVADGYGRNYLLPRRLAVLANSAASNVVEAQLKKIAVKRAQTDAEMTELATKLDGMEVTLKAILAGKLALITPVMILVVGLWVAMIKCIPMALASWASLEMGCSISLPAVMIRSANSSMITTIKGM